MLGLSLDLSAHLLLLRTLCLPFVRICDMVQATQLKMGVSAMQKLFEFLLTLSRATL